jgi:hypothetical protein
MNVLSILTGIIGVDVPQSHSRARIVAARIVALP